MEPLIEKLKSCPEGKTPALAYLRVSTGKQEEDGLSLDDQAWHAAKYCDQKGLYIVHAYSQSESARKEGRKNFNEMLDLSLRLGIKHLVFKSTDRMSRNYTDLVAIEKLIRMEGYHVHFFGSHRELHVKSSHYDFAMLGIEQTMAKARSDENSQYSTANNEWKARNNIAPGPPRYGYTYDRKQKKHIPKEPEIHTLKLIFHELSRGGRTLGGMCDHLNALGHPAPRGGRWSPQIIHKIVVNPFYRGEYEYKGQIYQGNHEAAISRREHERLLRALNLRVVPRKGLDHNFPLQNLVTCSCGLRMYGDIKKGRYTYYCHKCRDTGRVTVIPEDRMFWMFDKEMARIEFNDALKEDLKILFREFLADKSKTRDGDLRVLNNRIATLRARKEKCWEMYYVEDAPRDDIAGQLNRINAEIRVLEEQKLNLTENTDDLLLKIAGILDEVWALPKTYRAADQTGKGMILRNVIENATLSDGVLSITWAKHVGIILRPELLAVRDYPVMGALRDMPHTRAYIEHVIYSVKRIA